MTNGMEFGGMKTGYQDILQNALACRRAREACPHKEEESVWDLRKKRRKQWMALLKELEEAKVTAKKMAKTEYGIRQSSEIVRNGMPDHELNEEALALQIFSTLKMNVLLESFMSKKVKM